jgi:S-layer protein (TIGR01567 family)
MKKAILQMFTAILMLGLFCGAVTAAPSANFAANITEGSLPLSVAFQNQSENATLWQWNFGDGSSNSTEQNPVHTYTSAGKYTVNLTVTDANGINNTTTKENYINVLASAVDFEANVTKGSIPLTVGFTDKSTGAKSWQWNFGDGSSNSTEQNPAHTYTSPGTHKVTLTIINDRGNQLASKPKEIEVSSADRGNRIWDESQENIPRTYTWDAQSYSGFYYDLDSGVSSENMTIEDIGRNIHAGDIKYTTTPTETDFEYNKWGSYQVIGFMAEKYFAGYEDGTVNGEVDDVSLISDGILSKILIDSDDKKSAYAGDSLSLEEGYSLNVVEVDVNGNTVWVQLQKDGNVVDEGFISSGQNYVYKTKLGEAEDVPIIIAHFGTVFSGTETSAVFIDGLFQVSDNYVELKNGDTFGAMEVKSISSNGITMENEDNIGLDEGETIDLMGKIKLQVADNSVLRFAPILDTSEAGTYEFRGTVYKDGDPLPTWDPLKFEGFYYNIDEGIGTEKLEVEELNGREIPSDKLVYKSEPKPVKFEHNNWGNFTVVGFMADKYFAGYEDKSVDGEVDDVSLLSNNILSKVLIDTDDKKSMYSGSALALENGYSLSIKEVDIKGNSVWVQLEKDGKVVDDAFVSSNHNYIYKTTIGKAENVPLIIVHFGTVFSGTETSAVFTQGIFQLSDDYTEIKNGETFGQMEVSSVSQNGITMENTDDIGLNEGETTEVMGNISFKTADNSVLRFYPFVKVETGGNGSSSLKISVPDEIAVGDTFKIGVTAGESPVEGASVKVNTTNAGKTDVNGTVEYTAENVGPLKLTAEKEGYTTANKNVNVIPPKEKMTVSISPEKVYVGDNISIEAVKAIGGDPIEGANVSIDGNIVNKTGPDGKAAYTTDKSGTLKLTVTKEGFLGQDIDVNVRDFEAIFEFSNLVVKPLEVSAGKDVKISVDVGNTGNAAGNKSVELFVNGNVTDSKEVSLDVGKNTTVTFEHVEEVPGTYKVEIGGETATYTVKEKSSLLFYALGAIILLIVGGAAYYFTKGGGDIGTLQEKMRELIKK